MIVPLRPAPSTTTSAMMSSLVDTASEPRLLPSCAPSPVDIYTYHRIYASMKITAEAMQVAADQATELLKALANRHRLMIICQLIDGERSVGELAAFLG